MVCIREIKSPFPLFVARGMKTVAYLRVSTGSQDLANQKLAVLDYARQKRFAIDRFVEAQASSRKGRDQRRIEELLGALAAGDRLVVSELSRLGRSLSQVIQIVDELVKRKVRFIAIKEAIRYEGKQDMQTKVMIALFGLFAEVERDLISERTKEGLAAAEVERDLISERTKEGLAAARAGGRLLGRPKGSLGKSKLDGKEGEIRMLLEKEVSKASIAKIMGVSSTNLRHFIRTRKLNAKGSEGKARGRRP
jgi:DNA invertase Pin-like site-specific DNA recombinase